MSRLYWLYPPAKLKPLLGKQIIPADFLINKVQTMHKAYYGKDFSDHIPVEEVLSCGK